jgi:hypothetical protein
MNGERVLDKTAIVPGAPILGEPVALPTAFFFSPRTRRVSQLAPVSSVTAAIPRSKPLVPQDTGEHSNPVAQRDWCGRAWAALGREDTI